MHKITNEHEYYQLIVQPKITMAVFKTTWCKDCHFIEPFMPEIEQKYASQVNFVELDRDEFPELCEKLNILGIPSFIAFYQGQELVRFVSKLRKTREEIEQFIDRSIQVTEALSK